MDDCPSQIVTLKSVVIPLFSIIGKTDEVPEQPNELVTVTVIGLSAIVALIEGDVAPVDQLYVTNGLLVESAAALPEQYAAGPLIKGVGFG